MENTNLLSYKIELYIEWHPCNQSDPWFFTNNMRSACRQTTKMAVTEWISRGEVCMSRRRQRLGCDVQVTGSVTSQPPMLIAVFAYSQASHPLFVFFFKKCTLNVWCQNIRQVSAKIQSIEEKVETDCNLVEYVLQYVSFPLTHLTSLFCSQFLCISPFFIFFSLSLSLLSF